VSKAGGSMPPPPARGSVAVRGLLACCAAAFALVILFQILRYGVDVPFWDQWDFVRALRRISGGELSWARLLFASQGEHQIGMQVLLSAIAWRLTGMHMLAVMAMNWAVAALYCVLAMAVTRRALPAGGAIPWLVLGASAFFVFNPAAYQVWLWGLPLVHLLIPLLFLAGVFAAQSSIPDGLKIAVAAAAALTASFTLTSGLLLWAMFPPLLWHYASPRPFRRQRAAAAVYGLALLASLAPYALGTHAGPGPADGPSGPVTMAGFFLAYTGNLVSLSADAAPVAWAQLAGAALLLFFVPAGVLAARELYGKPQWAALMVWCAVGGYSILAGVLVALGRHRFGVPYAVESSRYVLASSFLPIACVAIGCLLIAALAARLPARLHLYSWTLCGTLALVLAAGGFRVLQMHRARALMEHTHYWQTAGKVAAAAANLVDLPQYRQIYSTDNRPDFVLSANFLNSRGWLRPPLWDERFVAELSRPEFRPAPAYGAVETAERTDAGLRLSGWARLADRPDRAHAVIVLGGGKILAVVFPSELRPDGASIWSAEIPAEEAPVRCFAYDAHSGAAHRLAELVKSSR
jgi:hypothetical protein